MSPRALSRFGACVLVPMLVALSGPAMAQRVTPKARQAAHIAAGKKAFIVKRWDDAIAELMKAMDYGGSPTLIYNLGRAHEEKGDVGKAIGFFKQYAALTIVSRKDRDEAKQRVERLEASVRTASGVVALSGLPPGAEVRVDSQRVRVSAGREVAMSAGRHLVEASVPGMPTWRQWVDVAAGGRLELAVRIEAREVIAPSPAAEPTATLHEQPSSALRTGGWVTMGLGVAFLGGAIACQVLANNEFSAVDDQASGDLVRGVTMSEAEDHAAAGNRLSDIAVAGYVVGGAAVITGIALLLVPDRTSASVSPLPGGGLVVIGGGF